MTPEQKALLKYAPNETAMALAIKYGWFYADVIPCINGEYSIGSFEFNEGITTPALFATLEEAEADHNEMVDEFNEQIASGVREKEDAWEGEVALVFWDGSNILHIATLNSPQDFITVELSDIL